MAPLNGWSEPLAPWREIRFCHAFDGTRLAFSVGGLGSPLVMVGVFASHLELDDQHPVMRAAFDSLQRRFTVVRYDERGRGLSRCDLGNDDLATRVRDFETVVDAVGLDRFAILAVHMGGPVGIAYSALHPDRVTQLILISTFSRGPALIDRTPREAFLFAKLIAEGWGKSARTRRLLSTGIAPGVSEETLTWLDEAQPAVGSGQTIAASYWNQAKADASADLANVVTPTLVIHAEDDKLTGFAEACRVVAAIPDAHLISFADGGNALPEHAPNWELAVENIASLISATTLPEPAHQPCVADLSARERQLLRRVASGMSNAEIAAAEYLSVRTVERHVSNIYRKLHLTGSSARTRAVAMYVRDGGGIDHAPT
ncbi:MAG: alpha/beta fold hydrolase [Dermatophilaceae bacterium]|nr:alpha/beta fold hydrolase [Intrasporangiaceae bacterium]